MTPDEWHVLARTIFDDVVELATTYGVPPSSRLVLQRADTPAPYYEHATQTISVGMPDPTTARGRLYWLFLARILGVDGVDEAIREQAYALPYHLAHELGHHLRHEYGTAVESNFVEEQVANAFAVGVLTEHPAYRERLPRLAAGMRRSAGLLATTSTAGARYAAGFRGSDLEAALAGGAVDAGAVADYSRLAAAAGVDLEVALRAGGELTAAELAAATSARRESEDYFNRRYMLDLFEYALFHFAWAADYLDRPDRPSLGEVVAACIRRDEPSRGAEARLLLADAVARGDDDLATAAVEVYVASAPADPVPALLDLLPRAGPRTLVEAVRALASHADRTDVRAALQSCCSATDSAVAEAAAAALETPAREPAADPAAEDLAAHGDSWRGRVEAALLLHRQAPTRAEPVVRALVAELAQWAQLLPLDTDGTLGTEVLVEERRRLTSWVLRLAGALGDPAAADLAIRGLATGATELRDECTAIAVRAVPDDLAGLVEHVLTTAPAGAAPIEGYPDQALCDLVSSLRRPVQDDDVLTDAEKVLYLRGVPLLSTVPVSELAAIATCTTPRRFPAGAVVFDIGDDDHAMYVVVAGRVRLEQEGGRPLADLGPRRGFGETGVFLTEPRSARAVAVVETSLLEVAPDVLVDLGRRRPELLVEIARSLSRRLREADADLG